MTSLRTLVVLGILLAAGSVVPAEESMPLSTGPIPFHDDEFRICEPSGAPYVDRFNCPVDLVGPGRSGAGSFLSINCGGFELTFEDEVDATGTGFDGALGPIRRDTACQVFIDLAAMINLGGVTPDILVETAEFDGGGPLASASPTFIPGTGCTSGALHEHIVTGVDPTPAPGAFDAVIQQVDFGDRIIGGTTLSVNSDWTIIPTDDLDLYSTILHEAMHALGFFSLIGPGGASTLGGQYSDFDRFLTFTDDPAADPLVNVACDTFDGSVGELVSDDVFYNSPVMLNTVPQPVYSPAFLSVGSSLSHFDDDRGDTQYVMRPSSSGGADRELTIPELDVLCDLGYTLFGTACINGYPEGVDDDDLAVNMTTPGVEVCLDVLDNDSDPDGDPISIDPGSVLVLSGGGTFTVGTELCYTPSVSFTGIASLYYQPTDGDKVGNVTNVLVDVKADYCPDDACSLACNGGFEGGVTDTSTLGFDSFSDCPSKVDNWCAAAPTPDLFVRGSVVTNFGIPENFFSPGGTDTYNGTPNDRYTGARVDSINGHIESLYTELIKPLEPGQLYELSFWSYSTLQPYGMIAALNDTIPTHPNSSNGVFDEVIVSTPETLPVEEWTQTVTTFSTASPDRQYLVIEPLFPTNPFTYVYFDDVKIREVSDTYIDIFKSVNDPAPQIGDVIIYTVTLCNNNPFFLNFTIEDVLPPGLTYAGVLVSFPEYTFFGIPPFACDFVDFEVLVTADVELNTPITNCVEPVSEADMCSSLTNSTQCADIIVETTDIAISKSVSDSAPELGSTIFYTVNVQNLGPSAVTNLVIEDLLPSGVSYVNHIITASGGTASYNPTTGELLASNGPLDTIELEIQATVSGSNCEPVTNTATLIGLDQTDLNFTNNQAEVTFSPDPRRCACVAAPDGMRSWWPFDETSGPLAEEIVFGPITTWFGSPVPAPGRVLGSLTFNGVDSYVESENFPGHDFGPASGPEEGDLSIDAWIRVVPGSTGIDTIVDKRQESFGPDNGYSFYLSDGVLGLNLGDGEGTTDVCGPGGAPRCRDFVTTGPALDDDEWHLVAVTVDRDDPDGITFYVDGVPLAETFDPTEQMGDLWNQFNLRIGRRVDDPLGAYFEGQIDEVELFGRELTPAEVFSIWEAGEAGKCTCTMPPPDMVGWWSLDEVSGSTMFDAANGNNGFRVGPASVIGMVDRALSFDGVNDSVVVADDDVLDFGTGNFSIDAWIRTTSPSGIEKIVDKRRESTGPLQGYALFTLGGRLWLEIASGGAFINYDSGFPVNDGEWHMVAATVSRGATNDVSFYVDGALVDTQSTVTPVGPIDNNIGLRIGRRSDAAGGYFEGEIDEVELFDRELTGAEILQIYELGSMGKCKTGCLDFNDPDGDGIPSACDNCPLEANPDQLDTDLDGQGDLCDQDADGDGVLDVDDVCSLIVDPGQEDNDQDDVGDACDNCAMDSNVNQEDLDRDGVGDLCDNCPSIVNPLQHEVPFLETLLAHDRTSFFWPSAEAVEYAKGDLRFVNSYHVDGGGLIPPGIGLLDASHDNPLPGSALWYLVRYPAPCGGWETNLGEQPGRQANLP